MDQERQPASPETDDSANPTAASPYEAPAEVTEMPGPDASEVETGGSPEQSGRRIDTQQMVSQLQAMIDQVATSASPALREIAAKAAELAAKAGERAGPLAQRAASMTQSVAERVTVRSNQVAADLRRSDDQPDAAGGMSEEELDEQPRGA